VRENSDTRDNNIKPHSANVDEFSPTYLFAQTALPGTPFILNKDGL
jgi:hypothetical protein